MYHLAHTVRASPPLDFNTPRHADPVAVAAKLDSDTGPHD